MLQQEQLVLYFKWKTKSLTHASKDEKKITTRKIELFVQAVAKKGNEKNQTIIQYQHLGSYRDEIGASHQRTKTEPNNNRMFTGCSNYEKTYLVNYILFQKQKPSSPITKSLNQCSKIKPQTSDEIELLENYENITAIFNDISPSKQASIRDLFFTGSRHSNNDLY